MKIYKPKQAKLICDKYIKVLNEFETMKQEITITEYTEETREELIEQINRVNKEIFRIEKEMY